MGGAAVSVNDRQTGIVARQTPYRIPALLPIQLPRRNRSKVDCFLFVFAMFYSCRRKSDPGAATLEEQRRPPALEYSFAFSPHPAA